MLLELLFLKKKKQTHENEILLFFPPENKRHCSQREAMHLALVVGKRSWSLTCKWVLGDQWWWPDYICCRTAGRVGLCATLYSSLCIAC